MRGLLSLREQESGEDTIHNLLEDVTDTIDQARKWREEQSKYEADFEKLLQISSSEPEPVQQEEPQKSIEPEREVIRCYSRAPDVDVDALLKLDPKLQINYTSTQLDTTSLSKINTTLQFQLGEVDMEIDAANSNVAAEKDKKLWETVDSIDKELKELEDMLSSVNLSL
eukprot:CAMPEP_0204899270 /NCGR_PEP_ID=MMETSP1397-20131031/1757_1 /ASSEMBLY_ACC=CAM_ASM_000891 /TAXON_ID=49980 /ORGANISM="Climacostomum Climacostomum virens, Strain Stock W-24" /LENGTH=168 /DNA_ID=CAMNT_0052067217 /DNA_START=4258 /DNA_END=4764 /DNA_ORIENTATION=-